MQRVAIVVVVALDSGVLNRAVHPFDLAIGPRMVWLHQLVLYPVCFADHVEAYLRREVAPCIDSNMGYGYAEFSPNLQPTSAHELSRMLRLCQIAKAPQSAG